MQLVSDSYAQLAGAAKAYVDVARTAATRIDEFVEIPTTETIEVGRFRRQTPKIVSEPSAWEIVRGDIRGMVDRGNAERDAVRGAITKLRDMQHAIAELEHRQVQLVSAAEAAKSAVEQLQLDLPSAARASDSIDQYLPGRDASMLGWGWGRNETSLGLIADFGSSSDRRIAWSAQHTVRHYVARVVEDVEHRLTAGGSHGLSDIDKGWRSGPSYREVDLNADSVAKLERTVPALSGVSRDVRAHADQLDELLGSSGLVHDVAELRAQDGAAAELAALLRTPGGEANELRAQADDAASAYADAFRHQVG